MVITSLPAEILCDIAGSPTLTSGDLARLNRCCRLLYDITLPLLYRRCTLEITSSKIEASLTALDAICTGKHRFVRELSFAIVGPRDDEVMSGRFRIRHQARVLACLHEDNLFTKLGEAIEKMENLRKFHARAAELPKKLLGKPSLRSLNVGFERDNEEKQFLPQSVSGSSILDGKEYMAASKGLFSLAISVDAETMNEDTMDLLRDLIVSSPGLKIVRLTGELFNRLFLGLAQPATSSNLLANIAPTTLELKPMINVHPYEGMDSRLSDSLFKQCPQTVDFTRIENLTINSNYSQDWAGFFPPSKNLRKFRCVDDSSKISTWSDDLHIASWEMNPQLSKFLGNSEGLEEATIVGCQMVRNNESSWTRKCFVNSANTLRKLTILMAQESRDIMDWTSMFQNLEWVTMLGHERHSARCGTPRPPLSAQLPHEVLSKKFESLGKISTLRVLRLVREFGGFCDPRIEDYEPNTEDENNAMELMAAINSAKDGRWSSLRFVCTVYCHAGKDWMKVWERTKDGAWLPPVKVLGRQMPWGSYARNRHSGLPDGLRAQRRIHGMGYRLGIEAFDAWDQWLEARI
ncbi:hypothetical protein RUND412_001202 [Rhizina undulata]